MSDLNILYRLADTIENRKQGDPAASYIAMLYERGHDAILKKIGEEATETVIASKDGDSSHILREVADLWFHSLVLLAWHQLSPQDVLAELEKREGMSGIEEKANRPLMHQNQLPT